MGSICSKCQWYLTSANGCLKADMYSRTNEIAKIKKALETRECEDFTDKNKKPA